MTQTGESYFVRILLPASSSLEHATALYTIAQHMVSSLLTWILHLGELFKVIFQTSIGQWAF